MNKSRVPSGTLLSFYKSLKIPYSEIIEKEGKVTSFTLPKVATKYEVTTKVGTDVRLMVSLLSGDTVVDHLGVMYPDPFTPIESISFEEVPITTPLSERYPLDALIIGDTYISNLGKYYKILDWEDDPEDRCIYFTARELSSRNKVRVTSQGIFPDRDFLVCRVSKGSFEELPGLQGTGTLLDLSNVEVEDAGILENPHNEGSLEYHINAIKKLSEKSGLKVSIQFE